MNDYFNAQHFYYINDLLSLAPHIFSYADDTAVFALQKNWILAKNIIIQSLNSINIWFVKNKLTLNLNKSMYITFGIKRNSLPDNNFSIKIANRNLQVLGNLFCSAYALGYSRK